MSAPNFTPSGNSAYAPVYQAPQTARPVAAGSVPQPQGYEQQQQFYNTIAGDSLRQTPTAEALQSLILLEKINKSIADAKANAGSTTDEQKAITGAMISEQSYLISGLKLLSSNPHLKAMYGSGVDGAVVLSAAIRQAHTENAAKEMLLASVPAEAQAEIKYKNPKSKLYM